MDLKSEVPVREALQALVFHLHEHKLPYISGYTSLLIAPGYHYKVPDAIITNFHMPQSTLLLLIAAYIGADWKRAYRYALDNGFRFLSYGDSCLFFKPDC
jgi:S-adenosylmethionine:tRNA ribosyltransferase-isomerase